MNGSQRYSFERIKDEFTQELSNKDMPERFYKSTEGITKIIDAIVATRGKGWATQVLNTEGNPLLNTQEQQQFTEIFEPYMQTILNFFKSDSANEDDIMTGGEYNPNIMSVSGLTSDFLKTKVAQATHTYPETPYDPTKMTGIDTIYDKIVHKLTNVNSMVNDYASKYGILKLEKEYDLQPDIRLVPKPAAVAISDGLFTLSTAAGFPIPPNVTLDTLSKIKSPLRTIIFAIYLILDISRIAIGVSGPSIGRKIMSILVAILELLRGDWKKSILTIMGYYGMMPMLIGELVKVFVSMFEMLSPQIQESIVYGSLDAGKSLLIGFLLTIFQITAPEEVRLPLIGILEKIAQKKAEIDGTLEDIGLSARPEYLSPTFSDFNNIQALMSDEAFICSCEFKDLVKAVNTTPIINFILQILRIPVNEKFRELKCGTEPCKDFVTTLVKAAKNETEKKKKLDAPISESNLQDPIQIDPSNILTAPVTPTVTQTKISGGKRILHSRSKRLNV